MKHHHQLLIAIPLLISVAFSHAMKTNTTKNLHKKLTAIKKPQYAYYLDENHVVIAGKKKCSIIDPTTDTEIIKISETCCTHLAVHPNKNKIALSSNNTITIYNTQTGKEELTIPLQNEKIISTTFHPSNDDIFLCCEFLIKKYNYTTNLNTDVQTIPKKPHIVFHPTKQTSCMIKSLQRMEIYGDEFYEYEVFPFNQLHQPFFCEYSPNGSLIVTGDKQTIYIINPKTYNPVFDPALSPSVVKHKNNNLVNDVFTHMAFHPNSSILATLSNDELLRNTLEYRDITIPQLIASIPIFNGKHTQYGNIAFSPNGKNIMITMDHKCVIFPVPFEVIYQPDTKGKARWLYQILKGYQFTNNETIPREITQSLISLFLETCKR